MGEVIAFVSGKGGTGKTSLCAGIATALALDGESVLCIDCDIGLRNLDISLGMTDNCALTFQDVYSGNYNISSASQHPQFPMLHFLTAPINCSVDEIDPALFGAMLREARKQYEYIFLDAPAGVEAGFRLCAQYADRVILVTGGDPAAVRDVLRAGEILELMQKHHSRMIVNRVNQQMYSTVKMTIDDIMDHVGLPLLGIVPDDPNVTLAAAFEKPLINYSKKDAAAACRRIAQRIQGKPVPIPIR